MKSFHVTFVLILAGIFATTKAMNVETKAQAVMPLRKVLVEVITLQPIKTGKLTKNNHIPVIMHISRSSTPTEIKNSITDQIKLECFSIPATHPVELFDQGRMSPADAEKYFTTPTGYLDTPSDSPLCLIAQECPSPASPLDLK